MRSAKSSLMKCRPMMSLNGIVLPVSVISSFTCTCDCIPFDLVVSVIYNFMRTAKSSLMKCGPMMSLNGVVVSVISSFTCTCDCIVFDLV